MDDVISTSSGVSVDAFEINSPMGMVRAVVLFLTDDDDNIDAMGEMTPEEAREMAHLLIDAADRAESGEDLAPLLTAEAVRGIC